MCSHDSDNEKQSSIEETKKVNNYKTKYKIGSDDSSDDDKKIKVKDSKGQEDDDQNKKSENSGEEDNTNNYKPSPSKNKITSDDENHSKITADNSNNKTKISKISNSHKTSNSNIILEENPDSNPKQSKNGRSFKHRIAFSWILIISNNFAFFKFHS